MASEPVTVEVVAFRSNQFSRTIATIVWHVVAETEAGSNCLRSDTVVAQEYCTPRFPLGAIDIDLTKLPDDVVGLRLKFR